MDLTAIPPSWEVLDQEAHDRGMTISCGVDPVDGRVYVDYVGGGVQASFMDHPIGRQGAQEMFNELRERER